MKKFLLLFSISALALHAFAQKPVKLNGALRVEGGRVVNKNGVPPQLRGISMSWSLWQGQKYYNTDVIDWLAKDFKASIIRAAMGVQPAHGYLEQPDSQKVLLETVVDRCIKKGIYVLIDWHDHNSYLHLEQSKAFFAEMAKRYVGKPNVIYEVWNEPERVEWSVVKSYAIDVITEIRKYDPDNLIIVGSPHWDQDVDVAAADPITGFKNIAYSFHFYATEPSHQEGLRARADLAMSKGLPLFVTEWGVGEANGNGAFDLDKNKKWLDWMEQHQLSWANWNITDKKETTAILQPGAPVNAHWSTDQLTPAGNYVRDKLRELNK